MPDELIETVEEEVDDVDQEDVLEDSVQDSLVITVNIDSTLSISGDAADAKATGDALATKASVSDVKQTLNVNGRTGSGTWGITVNGDNIPAQSDSDSESVADALSRIDGAVGDLEDDLSDEVTARSDADTALGTRIGTEETARAAADSTLGTRIGAEETARANADTALTASVNSLDGRVDALEANRIISVIVEFTEAGSTSKTVSDMTSDHVLLSYQFFDSLGDPTGDVLADMLWVTTDGSFTITFSNVSDSGAVRLVFGVMDDVTPQEVGS